MGSAAFLYKTLQSINRCERETDTLLVRGRGDHFAEEPTRYGTAAVVMWQSMQKVLECGGGDASRLRAAMQDEAAAAVVEARTDREHSLRQASADEKCEEWLAAIRQAAFVVVLKQVLMHRSAEHYVRQTAGSCGVPHGVCEGVPLQNHPLIQMTVSELLCQVRLLVQVHGVLTGTPETLGYLTGLLWRVAMEVVLTAPSHTDSDSAGLAHTASLMALTAHGSRESLCQQLLAEAEVLFSGVARDVGCTCTMPVRLGPEMPQSRTQEPSARGARARHILQVVGQITNRKQMQRAIIVARETALATVLCPYGKELAKRHELTRAGRSTVVTLYDRMCYKSLPSLLDDDAHVRPEVQDTIACVHAAIYASCSVALAEECGKWMAQNVKWTAWGTAPPEGLHLQRVFAHLVDSEGEYHDNLLFYLAKSTLAAPESAPPLLCG